MDSILEMYLFETNGLLEQLDSIALASEQSGIFSESDVNEIFRIMHTLKGASAMMEYNGLMTAAHRIEDMFFLIRENSMEALSDSTKSALFDLMFQAIDYFRGEVVKLEQGEPLSENIDSFLDKINSLIPKINADLGLAVPDAPAAAAVEAEGGAVDSSNFSYNLTVYFDEGSGMESLRAFMLVTTIREYCADSDFVFFPQDVETNSATSEQIVENGFQFRFRTEKDRSHAIEAVNTSGAVQNYEVFETQPAETVAAVEELPAPDPVAEVPAAAAEAAPVAAAPATPAPAAPAAAAPATHQASKESLISVNLSKLDQLMAVVGEIVTTESMVTGSPDLDGLKLDNFTISARQLRKLTDELQDVSMSLRMVPISGTFQKMNRVVRDMSKKLGKRVNLTLVGEHTEVDKTIVDSISDPIMHIVRNSMDHGIETSEDERIAAGKSPMGEIILSASHTGSDVIIEIMDDGQGVNYENVLNKALRQGLASPDVEYSHREILNFLLMPGFSTNSEVTEFSGRGVGMDVAKQNVEDVGGTVTITSEPGKGMTTTLKIPLTMAIMDGMEVSVGSSIFTIPINNIRKSFKATSEDVVYDASRGEMVMCMDNYYPIIRVKDLYNLDWGTDDIQEGILMWVEAGEVSYCLFVDELVGQHQVVVKPLPEYLAAFNIKNYGIIGCTILSDGSISIILDVANIYSTTV